MEWVNTGQKSNNCQKGSSPSHRQPCAPWALHVPPVWRAHSHDYCTIVLVRMVPRLKWYPLRTNCAQKKNLKLFHGIRYGEWSKISTLKIEQLVIIYLLPIASVDHKMTNFVVPFRIPFCEHHPHHYNRLNPDISSLLLLGQRLLLCLTWDLVRQRRGFITIFVVRSMVGAGPVLPVPNL